MNKKQHNLQFKIKISNVQFSERKLFTVDLHHGETHSLNLQFLNYE